MNKQNTSPYYQGDLIFIFLAFFAISVIAIYAAGQFGQYGSNAWTRQIIYYMVGVICIVAINYFDLEQLEKLSLIYFYRRHYALNSFENCSCTNCRS